MYGRKLGSPVNALLITAALLLVSATPFVAADQEPETIIVEPGESIQDAIDAAEPGDTIHILAGTYAENLEVSTRDITIQGEDRETVILDGQSENQNNGIYIIADGVTITDLTVRDFRGNGIFYEAVTGFHVERVDALDNGPYGIYAIRSELGTFADSYATGHADSGFYLGEIDSCQCVIEDVLAEDNLIGYSGTGAGHIVIRDSVWRNNAAGIVPNVLPQEPEPQTNLFITDNLVHDNNNEAASIMWHFSGGVHVPHGLGIVIAGGSDNLVHDNEVTGHERAGIAISFLFTQPSLNRIVENTVDGNEVDILWDGGGVNNCFEDNTRPDGTTASFDAGTIWNTAGTLPDCDTPNAAPPDPLKLADLATLLVFRCEPGDIVMEGLDAFEEPGCHEHVS